LVVGGLGLVLWGWWGICLWWVVRVGRGGGGWGGWIHLASEPGHAVKDSDTRPDPGSGAVSLRRVPQRHPARWRWDAGVRKGGCLIAHTGDQRKETKRETSAAALRTHSGKKKKNHDYFATGRRGSTKKRTCSFKTAGGDH